MAKDNLIKTGVQSFSDPTAWSAGVPGSTSDAEINDSAFVDSDSDETVKSIGLGSNNVLNIYNGSDFDVAAGTGPNENSGLISVFQAYLTLSGGGTFNNPGRIKLTGDNTADVAKLILLTNNSVSLSGGGSIAMSIGGGPGANYILGEYGDLAAPQAAPLVNVDNTISGDGTIGGDLAFTNDGTVETNNSSSAKGGTLQIEGSAGSYTFSYLTTFGSFTNHGTVRADDGGTLIFGADDSTGSIDNEATVDLNSTGDETELEIAGNLTMTASSGGAIIMGGSDAQNGDWIASDNLPATLTLVNQTIKGAGTIGDNDLTLDNVSGTIDAVSGQMVFEGQGPTIINGGMIEASTQQGQLVIKEGVDNSGTLQAVGGGEILLEANVSGPGPVNIGAGSSLVIEPQGFVTGNVTFTGAGAELKVNNSWANGGIGGLIAGAVAGDEIDLTGVTFESGEHAVWDQTSASGGTLSIYLKGSDLYTLNLAGTYNSLNFTVSNDGASGSLITVQNTPSYTENSGNNDEWILSDGNWIESAGPGSHPSGYNVALTGDWTGKGTDGILWFNPSTGDTDEWQLSNTQWSASVDLGPHPANGTDAASYQIAGTDAATDFTGDGIDDVLWTSPNSDGTIATDIWELNSSGKWAASASPGNHPAGYSVAGTGDWTGSGTDGILWFNSSTGDTDEWQLSGGNWAGSVDLGTHTTNATDGNSYQIAGIGDFTNNGIDDVLWTSVNNDGTVATDIWELNSSGQWMASVSPGNHPAGYAVVGVGDFTGTGTSDILWYDASTGDTDEWLINNGKWANSIDLGTHPGTGWQIAGVGDFNGAGNAGILWHT